MTTIILLATKLGPLLVGAVTAIGGMGIFLAVKKARVRIIQVVDGSYIVKVRLGLAPALWLTSQFTRASFWIKHAGNFGSKDRAVRAAVDYLAQRGVKHDAEILATVSESADGTPTLRV